MPTLVKNDRRGRVLVAFDPGISGAAAFHTVETGHLLTAEDLPVVAGQVDAVSVANRLSEMKPVAAFVERVSAMPKQGVTSTFKFGQANGVLIGILAALQVPVHFVTPSIWKKHWAGRRQGKIPAEGLAALSRNRRPSLRRRRITTKLRPASWQNSARGSCAKARRDAQPARWSLGPSFGGLAAEEW